MRSILHSLTTVSINLLPKQYERPIFCWRLLKLALVLRGQRRHLLPEGWYNYQSLIVFFIFDYSKPQCNETLYSTLLPICPLGSSPFRVLFYITIDVRHNGCASGHIGCSRGPWRSHVKLHHPPTHWRKVWRGAGAYDAGEKTIKTAPIGITWSVKSHKHDMW